MPLPYKLRELELRRREREMRRACSEPVWPYLAAGAVIVLLGAALALIVA